MPRKNAPRGATPLTTPTRPMHHRPLIWVATVGSLLLIMGLSLSSPKETSPPTPSEKAMASLDEGAPVAAIEPQQSLDPAEADPSEPPWNDFTVREGDNLSLIFNRAGFTDTDLFRVANGNEDRSLKRIYPGETIGFQADAEGDLLALRHQQSPLLTTTYLRDNDLFIATDQTRVPDRIARDVSMTIDSSLFLAGTDAGLSDAMIMELAGIFGGVIDFVLDPRVGDTIHVLYEELMLDGARFDDGPILAASFTNRGETFEAYRYTDSEGDTSYYNELGVSMRKAFLLAPLDFTRVSSNFNRSGCTPFTKPRDRIAAPTMPRPEERRSTPPGTVA